MAKNMRPDAEFATYVATHPPTAPIKPEAVVPGASRVSSPISHEFQSARQRLESAVAGAVAKFVPILKSVKETIHKFNSFDGVQITIHEFVRADLPETTEPSSAILYLHGGGYVSCPIENIVRPCMAQFAWDFSIRTFGVEFRYAPEYPHPTPIEDCFAGLKWLIENSKKLKIDPKRIGVFGESAGGGLVAALALLARDRSLSPPIAKQLMVYPMLDDRSSKRHFNNDSPRDQSLSGMVDLLDICWSAYLGAKVAPNEESEIRDISIYASPARATDLSGLPPAYIEVGGLDWFRDETLEFAAGLAKADVDVELHLYRGVPHIFELLAPDVPVTKNAMENRRRSILDI